MHKITLQKREKKKTDELAFDSIFLIISPLPNHPLFYIFLFLEFFYSFYWSLSTMATIEIYKFILAMFMDCMPCNTKKG